MDGFVTTGGKLLFPVGSEVVESYKKAEEGTKQLAIAQEHAAEKAKILSAGLAGVSSIAGSLRVIGDVFKSSGAIDALENMNVGVKNAVVYFGNVITVIPQLVMGIYGVSVAAKALSVAMASNPIGMAFTIAAVIITSLLIPAIGYLIKNWDILGFQVQKFILFIGHGLETLAINHNLVFLKIGLNIANVFQGIVKNVIDSINKMIQALNTALKTNIKPIDNPVDKVVDGLKKQIKETENLQKASDKAYNAQTKAIDKKIVATQKDLTTTKKVENSKQELIKETGEVSDETTKKQEDNYKSFGENAKTVTGSLQGMFDQYYSNQINNENTSAEEKKRLQREQFVVNKAIATGNAVVNTIEAVTKAMTAAPPPYNFILAGIVGTAGTIQTALIAAQPMPSFAAGGVSPGGNVLVGEYGAEVVNLPAGARVYNNQQSQQMLGGGGDTYNITINGGIQTNDPVDFRNQLIKIARYERARA